MKRSRYFHTPLLLLALSLLLTACLGPNNQQTKLDNGANIEINKDIKLAGKLYLTLNRNLYMLDSSGSLKQLTKGLDVRDPAISPDGKNIAFEIRHKNYSEIAIMPAGGGTPKVILSGNGKFVGHDTNGDGTDDFVDTSYAWYAQPIWRDNTHLIFLSDIWKYQYWPNADEGRSFAARSLELMAFSADINNPTLQQINAYTVGDYPNALQPVTYAITGDGGHRDISLRPNHPDQIIFTNYQYDSSNEHQLIQICLQYVDGIKNAPPTETYRPGLNGIQRDPSLALTPQQTDMANMLPSFSPDGNTIAYIKKPNVTNSQAELRVMPVIDDSLLQTPNEQETTQKALQPYDQSTLILSGEYVTQPAWTPDGKYISYISYSDHTFQLSLIEVAKENGKYSKKGEPITLIKSTDPKAQINADSRFIWTK